MRLVFTLAVVCLMTLSAGAFQPVPKESAKALGVTRGRPFSSGAVFVNGKYLEPPYVVERWGTGLRVNSVPVTGQVIDWEEFVKTQQGARVVKTETAPAPAAASAPEPAPAADDIDSTSLDDLFDDVPKAKKPATPARSFKPSVAARPRVSVSYEMDGDFVPNEASKALLARINAARTEIDRSLRAGGFICFGDGYSQVTGDSRTLLQMLKKLPDLMMDAADAKTFGASVRAAGLHYLGEVLLRDLFRNRDDYRKLRSLRKKLEKKDEMNRVLDDFSRPLL